MSVEPKTGLTLWPSGAIQQDLLFNAFLLQFAAAGSQPTVIDKDLTTPPAHVDGNTYIVGPSATGAWSGKDGNIAYSDGASWTFYVPSEGWHIAVLDEDADYRHNGSAWVLVGSSFTGGSLTSALNEAKGSNIASASTTDIGAATGNLVHVTGTTTITALGTIQAGTRRVVVFDGALTLTHNATSLILPNNGSNITTAAGDVAIFVSEGSGNWRCAVYQKINGQSLVSSSFTGGNLSSALNEAKGSDIASASTTDIGAATGNFLHVTGTTTITALGTVQAGSRRIVRFAGALILTHNATSLILPTGANITTAANDIAEFVSEGSGNWRCTGYIRANGQALAGGGGLTNLTEAVNSSAPNGTIPAVSLTPNNAASSVDLVLKPKGVSGALLAGIPDNTSTGGNKRGAQAVDLQIARTSADQVASGTTSTLSGGTGNKVGGNTASCGGGASNDVSGSFAVIPGGSNNIADGDYSIAEGLYASARGRYGYQAHASGIYSGGLVGEAQQGRMVLKANTTNNTQTTLTSDLGAASAANQVSMSLRSRACVVKGTIQAFEKATDDCSAWEFTAYISRPFTGSVAMVAACTPTLIAQKAGAAAWAVAVDADTTNNALRVRGTGETSKTIRWMCSILDVNEIGFF